MDQKYLAEIKAREQAATRGPWEVKTNRHPETTGEAWGWIKGPCENWCWTDMRSSSRHDAEFIAHSRADIPALLAEMERLQNVVKIQRASCNLVEMAKAATIVDGIVAKDQQIATLKKALEYACADRATTPSMWQDLQKKYMEIAHQAQEQEGKK